VIDRHHDELALGEKRGIFTVVNRSLLLRLPMRLAQQG
jgi:hypothetical protein